MTEVKHEAPAELTAEEIAAVSGGNGLLGSGGGRSESGTIDSRMG